MCFETLIIFFETDQKSVCFVPLRFSSNSNNINNINNNGQTKLNKTFLGLTKFEDKDYMSNKERKTFNTKDVIFKNIFVVIKVIYVVNVVSLGFISSNYSRTRF